MSRRLKIRSKTAVYTEYQFLYSLFLNFLELGHQDRNISNIKEILFALLERSASCVRSRVFFSSGFLREAGGNRTFSCLRRRVD